jgi:archaemetzincin
MSILRMKTAICIQPMGQVDKELLGFLKDSLDPFWPTRVLNPIDIPEEAYDKNRNQYDGSALLESLPRKEGAILGVTAVDTYAEGLNFIFGLAYGRKALISLMRLRPEFYDLPEDETLFRLRARKEAVHEIGHVFGLQHCPNDRCVMHFSNSILDTDFKDWRFCRYCGQKLSMR